MVLHRELVRSAWRNPNEGHFGSEWFSIVPNEPLSHFRRGLGGHTRGGPIGPDDTAEPTGVRVSTGTRSRAIITFGMLVGSLWCITIAPAFMPQSYSWLEHSISEPASQGVAYAWISRLGFLLRVYVIGGFSTDLRSAGMSG